MPSSTPERQERWHDDQTAVSFLERNGWTLKPGFVFVRDKNDQRPPTALERDAIIYMIEEWDYGGWLSLITYQVDQAQVSAALIREKDGDYISIPKKKWEAVVSASNARNATQLSFDGEIDVTETQMTVNVEHLDEGTRGLLLGRKVITIFDV